LRSDTDQKIGNQRAEDRPAGPRFASSGATRPLISVVTPFFNTAPYLAECIESVLAQSYLQFEYVLMDNCSTDGSSEIAATYASRDPRIRLIRCSQFLPQVANYNRALTEISDASAYCKIVQADDYIFPECLQLMVRAFEQSESIGLVSSYWLDGIELCGSGLPRQTTMLPGGECIRRYLRTGTCFFGSQTQVMYRASLVRDCRDFYNVYFPYCDMQKHWEILERWNFGFVHQVLSFSRRDIESALSLLSSFAPGELLGYIFSQRYASVFLEDNEAASIKAMYKRNYYRCLARAALQFRGREFWEFHKNSLAALDKRETIDWNYLAMTVVPELLRLASNPGMVMRALRSRKRQIDQRARLLKKSVLGVGEDAS
jgi:glycosyltransferase involved in cell wall biosynthesis